jgi:hypothetical protein
MLKVFQQFNSELVKKSVGTSSILLLGCLGLLVSGSVLLTGCAGGGTSSQQEAKKEPALSLSVEQVDQRSVLGDRTPDGQYMVAKVAIKNNTNNTITLDPAAFVLENITNNEKERYSQPAERGMTVPFGTIYGEELKSKVMDYDTPNLYPRMQIERYFVFMVPSEAEVNGYQITYKPENVSTPLANPEATINDQRNQSTLPNASQSEQSNKP